MKTNTGSVNFHILRAIAAIIDRNPDAGYGIHAKPLLQALHEGQINDLNMNEVMDGIAQDFPNNTVAPENVDIVYHGNNHQRIDGVVYMITDRDTAGEVWGFSVSTGKGLVSTCSWYDTKDQAISALVLARCTQVL